MFSLRIKQFNFGMVYLCTVIFLKRHCIHGETQQIVFHMDKQYEWRRVYDLFYFQYCHIILICEATFKMYNSTLLRIMATHGLI